MKMPWLNQRAIFLTFQDSSSQKAILACTRPDTILMRAPSLSHRIPYFIEAQQDFTGNLRQGCYYLTRKPDTIFPKKLQK